MKNRIIKFNDHYRVQTKFLFWWITEAENYINTEIEKLNNVKTL
jgi:hypothetical protein